MSTALIHSKEGTKFVVNPTFEFCVISLFKILNRFSCNIFHISTFYSFELFAAFIVKNKAKFVITSYTSNYCQTLQGNKYFIM